MEKLNEEIEKKYSDIITLIVLFVLIVAIGIGIGGYAYLDHNNAKYSTIHQEQTQEDEIVEDMFISKLMWDEMKNEIEVLREKCKTPEEKKADREFEEAFNTIEGNQDEK